MSNFSLKKVLMFVLYAIILTLFVVWYLSGDKYKRENKSLKNDIANIQKERDNLSKERDSLRLNYDSLVKKNDDLYKQYMQLDSTSNKLQQELSITLNSINKLSTSLNSVNKKINDLETHPTRKNDDDLLKSLDKINN